jgi:hypothetical protein
VRSAAGAKLLFFNEYTGEVKIRAQRIEPRHGWWGHPAPRGLFASDVPGDQGGRVLVQWLAGDPDVIPGMDISHYSIWRSLASVAVAQLETAEARGSATIVRDASAVTREFSGAAIVRGDHEYWEWVGNQDAFQISGYAFAAPTLADATIEYDAEHSFLVMSHVDSLTFVSTSIVAQSVDNLAPEPPIARDAIRSPASVDVTWSPSTPPDLRDYAVYRAGAPNVPVDPAHFVGVSTETTFVDTTAPPTGPLYYVVTAIDVHENESAASNELLATGPGSEVPAGPVVVSSLALLPCAPNPFASATALRFGMPAPGMASVEILDVTGRRVRIQTLGERAAGWHVETVAATDADGYALPSGVYFVRLVAGGESRTAKMVVRH